MNNLAMSLAIAKGLIPPSGQINSTPPAASVPNMGLLSWSIEQLQKRRAGTATPAPAPNNAVAATADVSKQSWKPSADDGGTEAALLAKRGALARRNLLGM